MASSVEDVVNLPKWNRAEEPITRRSREAIRRGELEEAEKVEDPIAPSPSCEEKCE